MLNCIVGVGLCITGGFMLATGDTGWAIFDFVLGALNIAVAVARL